MSHAPGRLQRSIDLAARALSLALILLMIPAYRRVAQVSGPVLSMGRTWALIPVIASAFLLWTGTARPRATWAAIGAIWGLVIVSLWGVGPFFIPAALLALGIGVLVAVRRPHRLVMQALSFGAGATGVCFANFVYWKSQEYTIRTDRFTSSARVDVSDVVRYGAIAFVAIVGLLGLIAATGRGRSAKP